MPDEGPKRAHSSPGHGGERTLEVTPDLVITEADVEESFVRAPGPGGQHVNKASTAVQLRLRAAAISRLPEEVQARLRRIAGSRLTDEGDLLIVANRHRSQARNRSEARSRLVALLARAARTPVPRKPSRPPKAAIEKRLQAKRRQSERKRQRRRPALDEQ